MILFIPKSIVSITFSLHSLFCEDLNQQTIFHEPWYEHHAPSGHTTLVLHTVCRRKSLHPSDTGNCIKLLVFISEHAA